MTARGFAGRAAGVVTVLVALLLAATAVAAAPGYRTSEGAAPDWSKGKRKSGVQQAFVVAAAGVPMAAPEASGGVGFAPQVRAGFTVGDQWEPAIAADSLGHVYIFYAQYLGVPGCPECASPTGVVQVSDDRGATWSAPRLIHRAGATEGQWDPQIVVDPVDGRTVYASWLQNGKSDVAVARSDDFGATWHVATADATNAGTDKPILAVRGDDVYVGYNHSQTIWVSASHDRGETWTSVKAQATGKGKLGWSLASGGTVTPNGDVHFSWAGYEQNGVAKGPVNLYVSSSRDRGATWTDTVVDTSGSPPSCAGYLCGWAYLGAQLVVTSDDSGTLYGLWNAGPTDQKGGPNRVWFAKSSDGGRTWSSRSEVSSAPADRAHAFPAITARGSGDVRISWMDARAASGTLWNTWYRSSTNGGTAWTAEQDISSFVPGYPYIKADGFDFPFGDYYELAIDDAGTTHAVFGEGRNYDTPGSIWYTRGR